jgi:ATP-dependent Zn protease
MNSNTKRAVFYLILLCMAALLWALVRSRPELPQATYSQFLEQVKTSAVDKAVILAGKAGAIPVAYSLKNGGEVRAMLPWDYREALALMQDRMVNIEIRDGSLQWLRLITNASPFLILLGLWFFMLGRLKAVKQR